MSAHPDDLDTLKHTFTEAYENELKKYADNRTMVLEAIRKRHAPDSSQWDDVDIAIFLAECHDGGGALKSDDDSNAMKNPVFAYIQKSGRGKERFAMVFGQDTPNTLDQTAGDLGRFLVDAIHMDIVSRLQADDSQEAELNPAGVRAIETLRKKLKARLILPETRGTETVMAAQQVQAWSDAALNAQFTSSEVKAQVAQYTRLIAEPVRQQLLEVLKQSVGDLLGEQELEDLLDKTARLEETAQDLRAPALKELHGLVNELEASGVGIDALVEKTEKLVENNKPFTPTP